MNPFLQIIMGTLGTLGFNLLFHIRGRKLLFATLGGTISWAVFLALGPWIPSEATRYFLSTAVITAYGEVLARAMKTPTTTFLVPSIIPLIPGSALYYTANYALNRDWNMFIQKAFYTLQLAVCLAAGIIAVTTLTRLITTVSRRVKKAEQIHQVHHSLR